AFDVFAEGKFHPARGVFDEQFASGLTVFHLEHGVLAAHAVRAPVENAGRGHAAGGAAVNLHVFAIEHVLDADFGHHGKGEFIDAAVDREVGVRVNDARHDEHTVSIENWEIIAWRCQVFADRCDLATGDHKIRVGQRTFGY